MNLELECRSIEVQRYGQQNKELVLKACVVVENVCGRRKKFSRINWELYARILTIIFCLALC